MISQLSDSRGNLCLFGLMMPLFVTIKETGADGSASLAGVASCSVQSPQAGQNGFATSLGCNKGRKCHTGGMGGVRSQSERGMGLRLPGFSHLHFQRVIL